MTSSRTFALFDFDGVIANSFALACEIALTEFPELTETSYRKLFEGNIYDAIAPLKRAPGVPEFFDAFVPRMKNEVHCFAGIPQVLEQLASEHTLIVVSSTISLPINTFLEDNDLARFFSDVMGADVHTSKVEKMRMVFGKYETDASHCVFITDTLGDMREAKEHELGVIACSWGTHDRATLERGIPSRIIDQPSELPDAVDDYFSR